MKKKQEQKFLECLIKAQPELFDRKWEDCEPPDFKTPIADGWLGLELARYFHPCNTNPPRQGRELYIDQVRAKCGELAARLQIPDCHITVRIAPERWPRVFDISAVSAALVELVRARMPEPSEMLRVAELPEMITQHGITSLAIYRATKARRLPFWSFSQFGNLQALSLDGLQSIATKHNKSLHKYRSRFSEVWLVVVGEAVGLSSFAVKPDLQLLSKVHSEFDRTFFFTLSARQFFELRGSSGATIPRVLMQWEV